MRYTCSSTASIYPRAPIIMVNLPDSVPHCLRVRDTSCTGKLFWQLIHSVSYVALLYGLTLLFTALMTLKAGSSIPDHYVTEISFCMYLKTLVLWLPCIWCTFSTTVIEQGAQKLRPQKNHTACTCDERCVTESGEKRQYVYFRLTCSTEHLTSAQPQ